MRIGLDGKVLTLRAGGMGRYAIDLTRAVLAEAAGRPFSGRGRRAGPAAVESA